VTQTLECICPNDDFWRCLDGDVYGPCSSDMCYGVCEYDGSCTCLALTHKPGTHGTEDDP
jgi:hypothetical protein